MMISDAELLKLVMDRYPEQPAQFLIEQFTVMKAGLIQARGHGFGGALRIVVLC